MLRNSSYIIGCSIEATDGPIGSVVDLLFEDRAWTVRWAVIDTGSWLPGRRVLLPPQRLTPSVGEVDVFTVPLTREQVEASPPEESDLPVSRRYEQLLFSHYQWDSYWGGSGILGMGMAPIVPLSGPLAPAEGDEHLRSGEHLKGYRVHATDGEIGHIEDLLIDPQTWSIPLLEVETRNWLAGRKVVVATGLVDAVRWFEHEVLVRETREQVAGSLAYDPSMTVDRDRLRLLLNQYGLPTDWI